MTGITFVLEIKEKLKAIYAEYSFAILLVFKFVLAFVVFTMINRTMGYMDILNSLYPVIFFSLICCLLSVKSTVLFAALMILGHSFALGLEVLGITLVFLILLFLLFIRFDEKDSMALLLTPLGLAVGVPCFIPICFGLKGKTSSAVSVACGSIIYSYIHILEDKVPILQNSETEDMLVNLQILIDGILDNKLMLFTAIALALVVIIVNALKRIPVDYIWHIAIGVGSVVYLVAMVSGGIFMDLNVQPGQVVLGTVISCVLALIVEFFVLHVDYSRTERMEFEDDEYYYYVKAVPKMTISASKREIKTITAETPSESVSETDHEPVETEVTVTEEPELDMMPDEVLPDVEKKLEETLYDL